MGVQCVDCVREGAATQRQARTLFGAPVRPGARPVVTIAIIAVCVVMFVLQKVDDPAWTERWLYSPILGREEPVRFLSAAFLHSPGSFAHILLNMLALWFVGPFLEVQLGRLRFASMYLLSAIGGSVAVLGFAALDGGVGAWVTAVVGASGGVFGLFGATFVVMWRTHNNPRGILGLIAVNMAFSFLVSGISWQGHVGGLVVGALVTAAYAFTPARWRTVSLWLVPVVALVLLAAVVQYSYPQAPVEVQAYWDQVLAALGHAPAAPDAS